MGEKHSYSGFGIRLLASILDCIVFWVLSFIISRTLIFSGFSWMKFLVYNFLIAMFFWSLYEILFVWKYSTTLGKMVLNCRIISEEKRISLKTSIIRYFSKWLSTILLGIGYLMIFWDKEKQGLHDKIAKTHVINDANAYVKKGARKFFVVCAILILILYFGNIALAFSSGFQAGFQKLNDDDIESSLGKSCGSKLLFSDLCIVAYATTGGLDSLPREEQTSLCSGLIFDSFAYECLSQFATLNNNKSMCMEVDSFYYERLCYKKYDYLVKSKELSGERVERIDEGTKKRAQEYYDSIYRDFDDAFISFQKTGQKINTVHYQTDLTVWANVKSSQELIDESSSEIDKVKLNLFNISESISKLKSMSFDNESIERLNELDSIRNKYMQAALIYGKVVENSRLYLNLKNYDGEYDQYYDKFISHHDLSNEYIDDGKFSSALSEIEKSLPYQDQMLRTRKEQMENSEIAGDIVARMYREEEVYTRFIYKKRDEVRELASSKNVPISQRFTESDRIYEEYNEVFVEPVEYDEFLNSWLQSNVFGLIDELSEILTEADVNYNSFIKDFELNWK